jgi:hypothetical protein
MLFDSAAIVFPGVGAPLHEDYASHAVRWHAAAVCVLQLGPRVRSRAWSSSTCMQQARSSSHACRRPSANQHASNRPTSMQHLSEHLGLIALGNSDQATKPNEQHGSISPWLIGIIQPLRTLYCTRVRARACLPCVTRCVSTVCCVRYWGHFSVGWPSHVASRQ